MFSNVCNVLEELLTKITFDDNLYESMLIQIIFFKFTMINSVMVQLELYTVNLTIDNILRYDNDYEIIVFKSMLFYTMDSNLANNTLKYQIQ